MSVTIRSLDIVSVSSTEFSDNIDFFKNSPLALMRIPSVSVLDLSNNGITDNSVGMVINWIDGQTGLSVLVWQQQ